jgi:5'-methylthioadenosine phosphorylase
VGRTVLGIIGGSGLYQLDGLERMRFESVRSSFGTPSDALLFGELAGVDVVFLARHGRGHVLAPSEINYRANIDALKRAGVTDVISISACGSLREDLHPGHFVLVDQFIDRTFAREKSFFGRGFVAHVSMAHPVCPKLVDALARAADAEGIRYRRGGTYVVMEGPQFSTLAESRLYRSWGADVIGMTNLQEAKLAREAEICYATIALVTDYDCWHPDHDSVTVDLIIANLTQNAKTAQQIIAGAVERLPYERTCECASALKYALITRPDAVPARTREELAPIVGKYLAPV